MFEDPPDEIHFRWSKNSVDNIRNFAFIPLMFNFLNWNPSYVVHQQKYEKQFLKSCEFCMYKILKFQRIDSKQYSDTSRACGGGTTFQLSDTVQINSPIVGQTYPANSDCTWTLNIPGTIHFTNFPFSKWQNFLTDICIFEKIG